MTVDLHVMPLWRFFAGDFDPPLARLGIPFKRVSPAGVISDPPRAGAASPAMVEVGHRKTANVVDKVSEANRARVVWPDEGDVVYSEQTHGMPALRAYVTWLDYGDKLAEFEVFSDDRGYDRHPVWRLHQTLHRPATFPHLAQHSLFCGYFLPCDFERPVIVQTIRHPKFTITVHAGSAVRLAAELEAINDLLHVPDPFRAGDFLEHAHHYIFLAFDQLRTVTRLSLEHRLPIIFEG